MRMSCTADIVEQGSDNLAVQLATVDEMDGFYHHLEQAMIDIGFFNPANPRQLMRRLRRLFNRSHLDRMELNILRGILAAAQKNVNK